MKGIELKGRFFDFFRGRGFEYIEGSSTVPENDASVLFTPAGMLQFKNTILNKEEPKKPFAYNSQKCIRAGGKHNDLQDVGKDVYHHTFFEMLGTWSFGTCDKKQTITHIWEFLTKDLKLDPSRLYVTYFAGCEALGLEEDVETKEIWLELTKNVVACGMEDNFWEMAETGPCGPCTEIHYDKRGGRDATELVNAGDMTVVEIWNIVFMQLHRLSETMFQPLEKCHTDTGAGFERLLAVVQNRLSNYDTDVFQPILEEIARQTDREYWSAGVEQRRYYRVVADHARMVAVAVNDGVEFGGKKRENVLRKVMRRAVYFLRYQMGGFHFYKIVEVAANDMNRYGVFVDTERVVDLVKQEEKLTIEVLERAVSIALKNLKKGKFDLEKVVELYGSVGLMRGMVEQICTQYETPFTFEEFCTAIKQL